MDVERCWVIWVVCVRGCCEKEVEGFEGGVFFLVVEVGRLCDDSEWVCDWFGWGCSCWCGGMFVKVVFEVGNIFVI